MNRGFWDALPKPFFVLAPMYDVTDFAFRQVVLKTGRPHVFFTEFVSSDGLCSDKGRERLMHHLKFEKNELPLIAQIFGAHPDKFTETAKLISDLGFSGIDINMGCPDKNIIKGGSCAALFKTPELAREIVEATKAGGGELPVSVKIRIGDTKIDWENWIATLLKAEPAAISIHLRTRKEMSKVPAHWEELPKIVEFIHSKTNEESRPLIVGNGDVLTLDEASAKQQESGCDGIMIGRGIFHNPWIFKEENHTEPTPENKIKIMLMHARLFEENYTGIKRFEVFKRFIKIYVNGFDGAQELREKLYECQNVSEIERIVSTIFPNAI